MSAAGAAPGSTGHPEIVLGQPRLHLRSTTSTNDRARALALAGAPHGTLVTASEQTAGRGRQGRHWTAPAGSSILMSLVLRWSDPAQTPALLPLLAGVAVCDVAGPEALVKWPNDIVLERTDGGLAKLAGILVEGRPQQQWAVLGIGLNVALELEDLPAELRSAAASLGLPAAMVEPTLQRLLEALAIRLAEAPAEVLKQLRARDALRGREVTWAGGHGHAEGIKDDGQLIVATAAGERVLLGAGEVHLHKPGEMPA